MARRRPRHSVADMPIQRSTSMLHVGRLAGIPIGIQPLWLVIVAFLTHTLGHDYFSVEMRADELTAPADRLAA